MCSLWDFDRIFTSKNIQCNVIQYHRIWIRTRTIHREREIGRTKVAAAAEPIYSVWHLEYNTQQRINLFIECSICCQSMISHTYIYYSSTVVYVYRVHTCVCVLVSFTVTQYIEMNDWDNIWSVGNKVSLLLKYKS